MTDRLDRRLSAKQRRIARATALREAAQLIADDSHAMQFQTMGQYRRSLIEALMNTVRNLEAEP